jgi:hypothetical protein
MEKLSQIFLLIDCDGMCVYVCLSIVKITLIERYYFGSVESTNNNPYKTYFPEEEIFSNIV